MTTTHAYIQANQQRFLKELKTLLRFPSVSAQQSRSPDMRACADWLSDHFQSLNLHSEIIEPGGHPLVKASTSLGRDKRILIYGHYDVQPEDPRDQWLTDPFEPTIKDGIMYARGATDDKGPFFAHVKAVETCLAAGCLPCDVTFLIEGEEECGADFLTPYIQKNAKHLACGAVLISDTCLYDENTPAITYGLRGLAGFEMTVTNACRDLHSGIFGGAMANPAVEVAKMIAQCVDANGKVFIPGFYKDVLDLEPWEREAFAKLPFDEKKWCGEIGISKPFGETGYTTLERCWARPTFEINGICGGYTGQGSKTIVPADASAKITMRLVPNQTWKTVAQAAQRYLQSICPDTVTLTFSETFGADPCLVDAKHPIMQKAAAAMETGFGHPAVFIREGGSIPIVETFSESLRVPIVLMGMSLNSNRAHSPNECFYLSHFYQGIAASCAFLQQMA